MLLRKVSLNRTVSCVTTPICERSDDKRDVAHVVAVDQQAAGGYIEKSRDQVDQRALAGAARTDHSQNFARFHFQIDVSQDLAGSVSVARRRSRHFRIGCFAKMAAAVWRLGFSRTSSAVSMNLKISDEAPSACWKLLLNTRELADRIV